MSKIIVVLIILALLAYGLFTLKRYLSKQTDPPVEVETVRPKQGVVSVVIQAAGKVDTTEAAEVKSGVSGTILEVRVTEGMVIQKGEILGVLEVDKENLLTAQKNLDMAVIDFGIALEDITGTEKKYKREVDEAQTDLERAKQEYERIQRLYDGGAIPERQFIEARNSLQKAGSRHEVIKDQSTIRDSRIRLEKASVQLETAKRELLRLAGSSIDSLEPTRSKTDLQRLQKKLKWIYPRLGRIDLPAPIDGTIIEIKVERGMGVMGSFTLFKIANMKKAIARLEVDEFDIEKVCPGQPVAIMIRGISSVISGRLTKIGAQVKDWGNQRKIEVVSSIENPEAYHLRFGTSLEAKILAAQKKGVLVLPIEAVLEKEKQKVVYIVEGDAASLKLIDIGLIGEKMFEIKNGLNGTEEVITIGNLNIKEGQKIKRKEK